MLSATRNSHRVAVGHTGYHNPKGSRCVVKAFSEILDSDVRLRVVTDALPIGIAYVNQERFCTFANQRFADAYGLTVDSICGKHADEFIPREIMRLGSRSFEAGHVGETADFTHAVRHADGRMLTTRSFVSPDVDTDGTVNGFYVCSINVTQQKAAEAAILQTQKMDVVGQLASGIAHDFNNLLAIILGNLMPLRDIVRDQELLEEYVEPAIVAAENGARLTDQLLAIARHQHLQPEPVNLESCVADFLKLLRRILPPNISVSFDCHGTSVAAYIDRVRFETVLLNLCVNARDSMPQGGKIGIEIDYPPVSCEGQYVRLVVVDTGCGMDEEVAAKAFEPFFTTKAAGRGSGLGLSMVWGFVRQSAGTVSVESKPGKGSRFTIMLPVFNHAVAPETAKAPTPIAGNGLVLVVDDNANLRRTVCRELARIGYGVIEAEDGEEALELVSSVAELRALVADIVMPGISGFRLAREASRLRPDLRIVLMTGFDGSCQRDREGLIVPVLRKPFNPTQLANAIEASSSTES